MVGVCSKEGDSKEGDEKEGDENPWCIYTIPEVFLEKIIPAIQSCCTSSDEELFWYKSCDLSDYIFKAMRLSLKEDYVHDFKTIAAIYLAIAQKAYTSLGLKRETPAAGTVSSGSMIEVTEGRISSQSDDLLSDDVVVG
ncbi:hypothetical protein R1sor_017171 [Riccia sorocarpa]|uniref:Uncharacterized protein n=1 Tax=Riccia sorocarpa TaxID=122646 RepID=A0ABD3I9E4_9MARC